MSRVDLGAAQYKEVEGPPSFTGSSDCRLEIKTRCRLGPKEL